MGFFGNNKDEAMAAAVEAAAGFVVYSCNSSIHVGVFRVLAD